MSMGLQNQCNAFKMSYATVWQIQPLIDSPRLLFNKLYGKPQYSKHITEESQEHCPGFMQVKTNVNGSLSVKAVEDAIFSTI